MFHDRVDVEANLSSTVTAALEVAGKLVLSQGLASSFRPRRYYTIPKDTLEGILEDVGQLIDFFLIEFQRVLFAENVLHTITVGAAHLPANTRLLKSAIGSLEYV